MKTLARLRGLYAITDHDLLGNNLINAVREVLQAGGRIIQYRDKTSDTIRRKREALALRELCDQFDALLIINDDIELAHQIDAHGVHVGKLDASLTQARHLLGPDSIIGVSCYNSLQLGEQACQEGADYVAFGSVFPSSTKPDAVKADLDLFRQAKASLPIPIAGIGGITPENAPELVATGCDMIAVIHSLFGQNRIQSVTRTFCKMFDEMDS
jgi:thiamine-phosphate pyrophosphorylase